HKGSTRKNATQFPYLPRRNNASSRSSIRSSRILWRSKAKVRLQKCQQRRAEINQVRKDLCKFRRIDTEPRCERRTVLIQRRLRNPNATFIGVVRPVEPLSWNRAVYVAALYRVSHYEVMASPGMVGAERGAAAGLEGPAEVGFSKGYYVLADTHLDG